MIVERKLNQNISNQKKLQPNIDGTVEISEGVIKLQHPQGNGKWPMISSGSHVRLFYNKNEIKEPTVIFDSSLLEFSLIDEPPHSSFKITVSKDKTEVILITKFKAGQKYGLVDCEPTQKLVLNAEVVSGILPEPINPQEVYQELQSMGIKVPILRWRLIKACKSLKDSEVVIAKGTPIVPPKDGIIEYVCTFQERLFDEYADEKDQIDFYDRGIVNSVEAGTVLAYWTPPVPGQAGRTVFGEVADPPEPENQALKVGKGVQLIDEGRIAVAAVDGRPFLRGRDQTLSVISQLVIRKDVDLSTGHIDFKGDVMILGDVTEGLNVRANGNIEIKGNVFHANIVSGANIVIHKKVVGGHVQAGGDQTVFMQINNVLSGLNPLLNKLLRAYIQVSEYMKESKKEGRTRGERYLLRKLAENQFPNIYKNFQALKELGTRLPSDEDSLIRRIKELSFELQSYNQVSQLYHDCMQLHQEIQNELQVKADVLLNYCQNAHIEATGDIVVSGPLAYNSRLSSGGIIEVNGDCRGGILSAKNKITVGVLGTETGVKTTARVNEGGTVRANQFYSNVWIKIGNAKYQVQEPNYKLEFRFDDEEWKKYSIY